VGAGTAFESVVPDYEPDELPHTLPCHKLERMSFWGEPDPGMGPCFLQHIRIKTIIVRTTDFPFIHSLRFYKRNLSCLSILSSPPSSFLLLAVFVARRLSYFGGAKMRTVGSSKGLLFNLDYIF